MATTQQTQPKPDHDIDAILAEVDERGYCRIDSVITPEQADATRAILEGILAEERRPEVDKSYVQRVGRIAVKHPVFLDLMCHPRIVAIWRKYLGEEMICSTWSSHTLYPGFDTLEWHADYPYWSLSPPWPTGNFTGQTFWMLDDFTEDNGATAIVPRSHRELRPPPDPGKPRDDAEIITGTRGSVVVAHGAYWHTARPNQTDRSRTCLLGMYIRPCFVTQEDMRGQLADLEEPSDLVQELMGKNQWQPKDV